MPLFPYSLSRPAGSGDLFRRLAAELVRMDRELLAHLAPRQHLHRPVAAGGEPRLAQRLGRHHPAGLEFLAERVDVDDVVLDAERVVEAAPRDAPVQRHLAAPEAALELEAGPRFGALVSASGGLAVPGALAAADSLLRVRGALRGAQVAQTHDWFSRITRSLPPGVAPCESARASPGCPSTRRCGECGANPCC